MNGENNNPQDTADSEAVYEEYLPPDAKPLCPHCLQPCDPLQYYCNNCDSNEAINPLAAYIPYVRIRFSAGVFGKLFRRACDRKNPLLLRIVYGAYASVWWLYLPS